MAIANVQRKGKGANASSISIGSGDGWATPTSGNLLVVSANSDATVSITGTWTAGPSVVDGNGTYFWYRTSNGTETTITCTPSVSDTIDITACEYSGTDASLFDVSNSSTIASSGGTTTTSVSVTTTASGDLIVAAALLHSYGNPAPTSPSWTNSFTNQLTATTGGTTSADVTTFFAELIAGGAGSYSTSASWTNIASDRQELVMAFKAAATSSAVWIPLSARRRQAPFRVLPSGLRVVSPTVTQAAPVQEIEPTRRSRPVAVRRGSVRTPVPAQLNPPFPFVEEHQPRQSRGMYQRRGEVRVVVPPQLNPPFPVQEFEQPRRIRGLPTRRGRVVSPVPAQVVVTAPAFPYALVKPTRGRLPVARRERFAAPPLAATSPVVAPHRGRPTAPPPARHRGAGVIAAGGQQAPPLMARTRHVGLLPPVRHRANRFPLPAPVTPPVVLGPDLRLVLDDPELRWLVGTPDGRWFTDDPEPRWAAGPPATEV